MSDDIIRIDGVEYEQAGDVRDIACSCTTTNTKGDFKLIAIRPKRKQTGKICRGCAHRFCVELFTNEEFDRKPINSCGGFRVNWQPFYGKVVE